MKKSKFHRLYGKISRRLPSHPNLRLSVQLGSIALLLLLSSAFVFATRFLPAPESVAQYTITLTDQGFEPSDITIQVGDTIKFVTTSGKFFWPASNLHPTHTIYPEFDPKRPIDPKSSWSFRFTKIGRWQFHDHLSPYFTGTIKVTGLSSTAIPNCQTQGNDPNCLAQAVKDTVRLKGVDAGLDLIDQYYTSNPKGGEICHSLTHDVGAAAFDLFYAHHDFKVTPKASYCNYGFYHGFMEKLVSAGVDLKKAGDFCDYVDKQLKDLAPGSGGQCYHGIGHGTVTPHDPSLYGNEQAMISPALKLCQLVAKNSDELFRCDSGVFNGIGNFYVHNEYGLKTRAGDPYWICRNQVEAVKESCYGNLHPAVTELSGENFAKAVEIIKNTAEQKYVPTALRYVTGDFARLNLQKSDHADSINLCRSLGPDLSWSCILDFVTGLIDQGQPNEEYVGAFNYCRSGALSGAEQDACFKYVLPYLATTYSKDKYKDVCQQAEVTYQKYCSS